MMLAKWLSIDDHIHNVHDHHSDLFPKCQHDEIDESEHKKKWIKPAYASKLMEILCDEAVREPQKFAEIQKNVNIPPPLASQFDHPDREEAVSKLLKRFNLP
ncbi:hypothetical protein GWK47_015842 [Chionoecetes opilio]|uniref:Uncharacterized protein n=1 Tax=Chionoecetes opilio TaxID=41210 RepID=A0A8J4XUV7_CHIOP|nr:hypothetical protein GWK47_015842 [Chionoecetes opilio]